MSRAAINANVRHKAPAPAVATFRKRLKAGLYAAYESLTESYGAFGMTDTAMYRRMHDPDRFTIGELRELRHMMGIPPEQMAEWLTDLL